MSDDGLATDVKEEGANQPQSAEPWLDMIKDAEKAFEAYQDTCDKVAKQYADLKGMKAPEGDREFAIFWANLEVLKPSIYSRAPVPVVVPRFKNRKPLPRKASELLERSLISSFERGDLHSEMKLVRDDVALFARGVMWLRYITKSEPVIDEATGKPAIGPDGQPQEKLVWEKVGYDHVNRRDYLCEPARKWSEVGWNARGSWLTREQGIARFGDVWKLVTLKDNVRDTSDEYKGEKKGRVWEIWHREKGVVVWVSPNVDAVLDEQKPFLDLENFYPCMRPAFGTLQPETLIPVPDFIYYRDQVEEINELTARISALSESLRLKGFYAQGAEDVAAAVERAMADQENRQVLVGVPNVALMGTGLKDAIVWIPVREVAEVINTCITLRRQLIEDVYQITGISDIMRGSTEASETLGAQQLKSQYGSVRIRDKQEEMVRLACDATRTSGEIMAENFSPETLLEMSQMHDDLPRQADIQAQMRQLQQQAMQAANDPQAQQQATENPEAAQQIVEQFKGQMQTLQNTVTLEAVVSLLRDQRVRPFAMEIETDSTIQPDENAQKERANEFITAVGGFMRQAVDFVQVAPEGGALAADMLKFVAGQFRAGRELQGSIDEFADAMKKGRPQQQEQPNPDVMKAQAEIADMEARRQLEGARMAKEMEKLDAEIEQIRVKTVGEIEENKIRVATAAQGPAQKTSVAA